MPADGQMDKETLAWKKCVSQYNNIVLYKNKFLSFSIKWMNLGDIPGEISWIEKKLTHKFTYIWNLKQFLKAQK